MSKAAWVSVLGVSISMAAGCGGGAERDDRNEFDIAGSTPITETGCLTSSGDRFVLTALEGGGGAETELYQLTGNEEELRPLVGREVRVTGDAEPAVIADIQQPAQSTGTSGTEGGGTSGARPQVRTEAETRLETRQLRVGTVTATGDECPGR